MSEFVKDVTDRNFETDVLKSDVPVLVDFWATWCGPCIKAMPDVKKAISVFPNNFDYFAIGTTYMKIKSNESHIEAIKYFNLILSSDKNWTKGDIYNYKPSKNSILLNKGVALMRLNKLNESIEIFLQLLEDGRSDTTIYHNLAINYYKLGNYDNSLYYVTKSLEINPSNDESLMLLQEILIKQ